MTVLSLPPPTPIPSLPYPEFSFEGVEHSSYLLKICSGKLGNPYMNLKMKKPRTPLNSVAAPLVFSEETLQKLDH